MLKYYFLLIVFFSFTLVQAQTFNSATNINLTGYTSTCVPITVTGVGTISDSYGLEQVCIDISTSASVDISLRSPDGTEHFLSYQNNGVFSATCFNSSASNLIRLATSPFTGTFVPETHLSAFNNDQDADGAWYICFDNNSSADVLSSASITFSSSVSTSCGSVATNECGDAPLICDFNGYCGSTADFYTENNITDSDWSCGTIDNNSFIEFVPNNTDITIEVDITNSEDNFGVQFGIYQSSNCSSWSEIDCQRLYPGSNQSLSFSGLTVGLTYYLIIDGYAGDVCDYSFTVADGSGVSVVEIDQGDSMDACLGDDVNLTIPDLPGVTYTWNWGSSTATGSSITVPNVNPPLTVSVQSAGVCNNQSDQIDINLDANCCGANAGQWD